ncbi:hypothetical protein ACWC2T_27890 [Streptomyces sp. NPDC001393]
MARVRSPVTARTCVFDRIVTEPPHRRRGSGTVFTATLAAAAQDQGTTTGLLGATVQARWRYESLGWPLIAPLSGFIYFSAR